MKPALLAVDPGVTTAGVALFMGQKLEAAWLVQADDWAETAFDIRLTTRHRIDFDERPVHLVVEIPQIYTGAKQKGRQKDLVNVAVVAGMFFGVFGDYSTEMTTCSPAEWKGQVSKEAMQCRILERLSKEEKAALDLPRAKSVRHNVYDAVGIGLWALKRL